MSESIMRGPLADAIRATHHQDVVAQLKEYEKAEMPDYLRKRIVQKLKDAERLSRNIATRNQIIQEALRATRTALESRQAKKA